MNEEDEVKRIGIERERRLKDEYFEKYPDSPISPGEIQSFSGLKYYPVNPDYRFRVQLQKYERPEMITLTTSKGTTQEYVRVGFFEFSHEGKEQRLQVYKSTRSLAHEESLFIPFRDETSGVETYGTGRYLDIPENEQGIYELDFNKAYNPYCAYSEEYVCPLAPRENWLNGSIRAGERAYKHL